MSRRLIFGLFLANLLISSVLVTAAQAGSAGRYIVVLKDSVSHPSAVASEHARDHGAQVTFVYKHAIKGYAALIPEGSVERIRSDARVAYVEADQRAHAFAQVVPTGVQRTLADENPNITIDGNDDKRIDVDVAIIDTGIDLDHVDLNVVASTNCAGGGPFRSSCSDGGGNDGNGHGTHVAGSVAAIDNGTGVVGVAPGARLWAVRVLDNSGNGYISWIVAGIDWVTARNDKIEVANMSLGCECSSDSMDTAIANSVATGIVYAVAAGNSDADAATHSPANHPDVITVSALADFDGAPGGLSSSTCRTDEDDTLANFSNWGTTIEVAAPGVCILSTWNDGGYNTISGTSMASPHVAGAAALLTSGANDPKDKAGADAIRQTIMNTGNDIWIDDSGDGIQEPLLDVSNTLVYAPATVAGDGGGTTNTAPVANDDGASTPVDTAVTIDVLANDTDADGDPLTVTNLTQPTNGSVVLNADNTVTYSPAAGFSGSDSFTYTANDGTVDSTVATVSVAVGSSTSSITLSATGYKVKGVHHVDLSWSGASGTDVAVFRNGSHITNTPNDGAHTDNTGRRGGTTYTYKICEVDSAGAPTSVCSNEATVTF
jgi:subtilisin family serine protease